MSEKKLLSICMVTQNHEIYIQDCLDSIKEIADEVLVADLGSEDRTVDIAKKAGADVFEIEWEGSFSKAKNFCLDHANGRWILFLEPEETISAEHIKQLKPLLCDPNVEGYLMFIHYDNERIISPVESLRLFRSRRQYRYQYRSYVRIPDELITNMGDSHLEILHRDNPNQNESFCRSALLEKDLKEHKDDCYLQYMYAVNLMNSGKFDESIRYLKKAVVNVNIDYLFAPHLYKCLGWLYLYSGKYTSALKILNEGIEDFPYYTDLLIIRGELYKHLNRYKKAAEDLESCLALREEPSFLVPEPEINILITYESLADIYEKLLNYQQALKLYLRAYEINNADRNYLNKIYDLAKKADMNEVTDSLFQDLLKQENHEQLMAFIDILFDNSEYTRAVSCAEEIEKAFGRGEHTEYIKMLCKLKMEEKG